MLILRQVKSIVLAPTSGIIDSRVSDFHPVVAERFANDEIKRPPATTAA
jgi:hypothetical protein